MSDSNSDYSQSRRQNRSVPKTRVRHRHRRCHKSRRKPNAATRLRIRYYELKIRLSDLYERISHSIRRTLLLKPSHRRRDLTDKASSRPKSKRISFSKNIKNRRKRYRSSRKSKTLRRTVSKTSLTSIRHHKRHNCQEDECSIDFNESWAVHQTNRKKRSSLTKAKRSVSEQKVSTNGKISRKSLGLGDITTSGGSKKSLHSLEKRPKETDVNGNEIISPEKESTEVGAEVDEDVKADVDFKETEETNKTSYNLNKIPKQRWPHLQSKQTRARPPPPFSRPQEPIVILPGIVSDTRRFWKRLGQLTISQLKLRRRDLDMVPPKIVKIGFGWAPHVKDEKRSLKIRRLKKDAADQLESQYAPHPYSIIPTNTNQYLYHRNDTFSNLLTTPRANFNATTSSLRTSTLPPTLTPATRKKPLTAINRQIPDSNIKFSSLIPQIRKAAADSRTIFLKLESSASPSKSTLPVHLRLPTIPDHRRDKGDKIASSNAEAAKIVGGGGGGGSLNTTSSAAEGASPKYSFNLASLIKYKYANPIATDAEYKPRINTSLDFGKPTTTPMTPTATFSGSNSAILMRSSYKPTTEFTAKFHHLLTKN